ncbi:MULTISPECIES: DNA topoisomerase IV subunit A [unclassified Granulicatella]|uniref:DNA topoisomerase IV subunit A n=1 Tax=unclassified Granulicatella TaxID=2630493 RepID=UPI001073F979|nr:MULTISPECIES: DNA topoisomerase IV subunit A [unclassified Granulicatella]MBF0780149.1 DNA topoisomerase IV subunit A [Granulicatella sp. 19428wC4_WM01]TFU95753.1 DNA topoisomerase IV subunit A [Granulicatella sp. WM01]
MSNALPTIQNMTLEDVMGDRFGRYSKYIIQDRALPDIRDGLKPVQRRILYAMYMDGNTSDKNFRKSAKTVGNVIANYHPHGDTSVYDAMVRLSQEWKLRETLVEMHGNNGSMDGDTAAAMRYTEARLSKVSDDLLRDIDKETVDFILNFDDTTQEPTVLPARFPNLLVNGSTGISAGYATDIPTHNLAEVIDATVHLLSNPKASVSELMQHIKGPDFPTGAIIQGYAGLKEAYETGRGKVIVRSKTSIETIRGGKQQIVIHEIPFDVNKALLVKRMDEIRIHRKIEGIAEVRDESDRNGLQIVVELKKEANAEGILNYLLKNTDLQLTYNFNMVAINNRRPQQVGLKTILESYIMHQKDVILRRTRFNLNKAKARLHIVDGLIKALSVLDEVIVLIRNSKDKKDAKDNLMATFAFSEKQAEAIVSLQLYRLTNTDITALQNEKLDLNEEVASLELIVKQEKVLVNVMKKELLEIKKRFGTPRLTQVQDEIDEIHIETTVLVPQEDVYVVATRGGYYKRVSLRSYASSNGEETGLRERDDIIFSAKVSNLEHFLAITSKGNYVHLPVHELPEYKWKELGEHLSQKISLDTQEMIVGATVITAQDNPSATVTLMTNDGMIKRTLLKEFVSFRSYKSKTAIAMKLKQEESRVVNVTFQEQDNASDEVLLVTHLGFGLRYALHEVPVVGMKASGVKSINLKQDDEVIGGITFNPENHTKLQIVLVTQRGSVKRLNVSEINLLTRAKRGLMLLKELKTNPYRLVYLSSIVSSGDTLDVYSTDNETLSLDVMKISLSERYSNGSNVLNKGEVAQVVYHSVNLLL